MSWNIILPTDAKSRPLLVTAPRGPQGISAFEVAVAEGFEGTEAEWLESLIGDVTPELEALREDTVAKSQTATTKAGEALASATAAGLSAGAAATSETNASGHASTATTKAGEATAKASEAVAARDIAVAEAEAMVQSAGSLSVPFATWTALAAYTGMVAGARASVLSSDVGTHTDPVVGGTAANNGVYRYSASPAGWERIGDLDSKAAQAARDEVLDRYTTIGAVGRPAAATLVTGTSNLDARTYVYYEPLEHDLVGVTFEVYAPTTTAYAFQLKRFNATTGAQIGSDVSVTIPAGTIGIRSVVASAFSALTGERIGFSVGGANRFTYLASGGDEGGFQSAAGNVSSIDVNSGISMSQPQVRLNVKNKVVTGDKFVAVQADTAAQKLRIDGHDTKITALTTNQSGVDSRLARAQARIAALQSGQPVAYTLHPVTVRYAAACAALGRTQTAGRLNRHSRLMDLLDAEGIDYSTMTMFWLIAEHEDASMINVLNPGVYTLTKNGSPTFVANRAAHGNNSTSNYYEIPVTLANLDQNDVSMGFWANSQPKDAPATVQSYQMGALDGSNGIGLMNRTTTSGNQSSRIRGFGTTYVPADATRLTGRNALSISRRASTGYSIYHHGVKVYDVTETSVAPVTGTTKLRLLHAAGTGTANSTPIAGAFIAKGLTDEQMGKFTAACEDFMRCVQYGDPFIYERGVGPAIINTDVVVYGLTPGAISAAYESARRGNSVALVGDWFDETIWDIGGMIASGLWSTDIRDPSCFGGSGREMTRAMQILAYGREDANTQSGVMIEPRLYNWAARRMFDATRTDTSGALNAGGTASFYLPGQDVKIYMTGGVSRLSMRTGANGPEIAALHTRDGRTFKGRVFVDQSYDVDTLPLALPDHCITGHEAAGTGAEGYNGFKRNEVHKPNADDGAVSLDVDPYKIEGNAASGYLPLVQGMPNIADGDPDPLGLQAMNLRITMSSSTTRMAPFDTTPPPGYDPLNHELLARRMEAADAVSASFLWGEDVFVAYDPIDPHDVDKLYDVNNGGAFSTDMPGSGEAYAAAGLDPVARRGVFDDIHNYNRSIPYWILHSGDSRITPEVLSTMQGYYLDPLNHLDPGFGRPLYWPRQAYRRDATFRLVNPDFVLDANDITATDGTTPRSIKTVACASYRMDMHSKRITVDEDGNAVVQGYVTLTGVEMGVNRRAPIPLEAITPPATLCANLTVAFGGSWTSAAHSAVRMEPTMMQIGDAQAAIIDHALKNNVALRDVDYAAVRADLLALPFTKALVLPQVN